MPPKRVQAAGLSPNNRTTLTKELRNRDEQILALQESLEVAKRVQHGADQECQEQRRVAAAATKERELAEEQLRLYRNQLDANLSELRDVRGVVQQLLDVQPVAAGGIQDLEARVHGTPGGSRPSTPGSGGKSPTLAGRADMLRAGLASVDQELRAGLAGHADELRAAHQQLEHQALEHKLDQQALEQRVDRQELEHSRAMRRKNEELRASQEAVIVAVSECERLSAVPRQLKAQIGALQTEHVAQSRQLSREHATQLAEVGAAGEKTRLAAEKRAAKARAKVERECDAKIAEMKAELVRIGTDLSSRSARAAPPPEASTPSAQEASGLGNALGTYQKGPATTEQNASANFSRGTPARPARQTVVPTAATPTRGVPIANVADRQGTPSQPEPAQLQQLQQKLAKAQEELTRNKETIALAARQSVAFAKVLKKTRWETKH